MLVYVLSLGLKYQRSSLLFTYRRTEPNTLLARGKIIIISKTARIAELVALTGLGIIVPTPDL